MISLPFETTIPDPDAMRALCRTLDQDLLRSHQKSILLLDGQLGAGKTTFCSGFKEALGLRSRVTSPSFNLLNIYESPEAVLYHYDLYRLRPEDIPDLEFVENWTSPAGPVREIHAIEWWQRAENLVPRGDSTFLITFRIQDSSAPAGGDAAAHGPVDYEREERSVTVSLYP